MEQRSLKYFRLRTSALFVAGLMIVVSSASAGGSWSGFSVAIPAGKTAELVAATDKLMSSEVTKQFPGRLLLQMAIADGANPSTHTFVPIYKSATSGEAWGEQLRASPAYKEFLATLAKLGQGTVSARYRVVKSWGEISDGDKVWLGHAFDVKDSGAFVASIDRFRASATGKEQPNQVHLSQVVAAGMSSMSHLITVGYASEAEMETAQLSLAGNSEWQALLNALNESAEHLGSSMSRTVKAWGTASMQSVLAP
jgi:hypothetical protein